MSNQPNKKKQYNKYNKWLSTEYVVVDENGVLKGDFKTAKEALEFKQLNPNSEIFILKTFKM